MEILLENKITIKNAPPILRKNLVEVLTLDNPEYLEAAAQGYSTYGINSKILNFDFTASNNMRIPRGCRVLLKRMLRDLNIKDFKVVDKRSKFPFNETIDASAIKYRPYQREAIFNLIVNGEEGVLVSPAGSGKTIMGLSLIPLLGQPTLWLTHTKALANQVLERIDTFLPSLKDDDVGVIKQNKWDLGNVLTVGMIPTMVRRLEDLSAISNEFGLVIIDECLTKGSEVLMLDGSHKDISEVKDGDITTFGTVTNKFKRQTDSIIHLRGIWGVLRGTPTHRLPFIKRENLTIDKRTNTFRDLDKNDVVLSTISDISVGDMLLLDDSTPHVARNIIGADRARLLSLIACDGHIEKNGRCLQVGVTKDKKWFSREMLRYSRLSSQPNLKVCNCKRGDLILRIYSKDLIEYCSKFIPTGRKKSLNIPSIVKESSLDDIKNYIQVVFDTEGGLNKNQITITMSQPEFIKDLQFLLKKFGILGRIIPIKKKNSEGLNYSRLALAGYDAFLFWKKIGFSMNRKQNELYEIVKRCNKFVRKVKYNGKTYRCVKVLSKHEVIGKETVYDFTTDQHFFIVNGILSSNCHHCPASTFMKVIRELNPYFLYALTATPYRRDKLETLMFQMVGDVLVRIPVEKVESDGGVIMPTVRYRTINSRPIENNNVNKLISDYIIGNDIRNGIIVGDVLREAFNDNICIVVSDRKKHCEELYELIKVSWDKCGIATGSYKDAHIKEQVSLLENKDITVLVTTFALLGEGFDVDFLNRAFVACPFRAEAKLEQLIGRIQRTAIGKNDSVVYDYVDADVGVFRNQFYAASGKSCRYKVYERLGLSIEPY